MESIQLAQMLADLSDLNAAEPQAASALVSANKTLAPAGTQGAVIDKQPAVAPNRHQGVHSGRTSSRTASPARFDKFGRRILTPPPTQSNSAQGSAPGTPRRDEHHNDIDHATTLMALYEIQSKLKQQDNTSLVKVREKIAALQSRTGLDRRDSAEKPHPRYVYPKST